MIPALLLLAAAGAVPVTQVANRCVFGGDKWTTAGILSRTDRHMHTARVAATGIRFAYTNSGSGPSGAAPGPNAFTLAAAIEKGGTVYPLTFGGVARTTVDPGEVVVSDPCYAVSLSPGDDFYSRTYAEVASAGQKVPISMRETHIASRGDGSTYSTTGADLTTVGSATPPASNARGIWPQAIGGVPTAPGATAVAVLGSSTPEGQGDNTSDAALPPGYVARACEAAGVPYANFALSGDRFQYIRDATEQGRRFGDLLSWVSHIVCDYGVNDLINLRTLAQMQADGIAFWGYLAATGKLVSQATFKPYTSSTDGWVTVENQTPGGVNPTRLAWNAWLRDGAPLIAGAAAATGTTDPAAVRVGSAGHPLDAVLEVADALESSRDSGVWTPGYTSDGLHPNPTGHAAAAAVASAWILA